MATATGHAGSREIGLPSLDGAAISRAPLGPSLYNTSAQRREKQNGENNYKALLEDAKRQRAEADAVIAFAERQLGITKNPVSTPASVATTEASTEIQADTFRSWKNIFQAAEKYLSMVGRPARSTEEIAESLGRGGVTATAGALRQF